VTGLRIQTSLIASLLSLLALAPTAMARTARGTAGDAAALLPSDLALAAVLRDGDLRLERLQGALTDLGVFDSDLFRVVAAQPGFARARVGLLGIATAAGDDPASAIGRILGRELAFGARLDEQMQPEWIAVSVPRDAERTARLLDAVHAIAGHPDPERIREVGEHRVFVDDSELFHCLTSAGLWVSNRFELLRAALARGEREEAPWHDALAALPPDAALGAFVDVARLRTRLEAAGGGLPDRFPQPLPGFLLGGLWERAAHAAAGTLVIRAGDRGLRATASVHGTPGVESTQRGFRPSTGPGFAWDARRLPGFAGAIEITRGWADLLADREAILELPAAGRVVQFASVLTTLLGGLDFIDDFLPRLAGPVRVAALRRDPAGRPYETTPTLPAFALVGKLRPEGRDPSFPRRLESAALMAIAFLNFEAAQQSRPTYFIGLEAHDGVRIVTTQYPPPSDGRTLGGFRYNFEPSFSVFDDHVVIATSPDAVRSLIDAARGVAAGERAGAAPDRLVLDGERIRRLLEDNEAELVERRMLAKDETRAQALRLVRAAVDFLGFARSAEITAHPTPDGARADLHLRLQAAPSQETSR